MIGLYGLLLGMFVVYGGYALITWEKKELAAGVEEAPKS
jgi:hypothetical protein